MAGVFSVLIFAVLFAAVVVNTTMTGAKQLNNGTAEINVKTMSGSISADFPTCEFFATDDNWGKMCDVLCTCASPELLSAEFEAAIADDQSACQSIGYHLRYDELRVDKISPGWFKTNAIINKITIRDVGHRALLTDIEPGAFNDCTFRQMTELVIRMTQLTVLKRGVFEGASSLKNISLDENGSLRVIEATALDPLYQLEGIKMIKQPQFENLLHLTGSTQFKHVRILTLNLNNFSSLIDADTFRGCTGVETIDLSNSSIETIGIGTFDHMAETIRYLDLRDNSLKHLHSQLLESLLRPNMEIYLSGNLWNCDCDSLALQIFVLNSDVIKDCPLLCDTPPTENGKNITDVDLSSCEVYSTTSTEWPDGTSEFTGPTTLSTFPTTPQPPFTEPLDCLNEKYASGSLFLGKVYQYFSVKQVEMGTVSVEISAPDPSLSMVVINDNDEARCRYEVTRQMTFSNLDKTASHLFCLIKKTSPETSPKNCYPFDFDDSKSIWGHDEIIIVLTCSIVLSLVVGLLCGWLLSCRYRRVFKAKESLRYRTSGRSESKTVTEIEDFNSSTSDYFAGRYGSVNGPNTKRLRRTYSDNSIISCKSYITAVAPSPFEIIHWKLRKNAINSNEFQARDYLDDLKYDCLPPPLPPHPNRRNSDKIYETIAGEPVYICTSEINPYKITYASNLAS